MAISYKKLWHILIDRDMKEGPRTFSRNQRIYNKKLTRNENVSVEILEKISVALGCSIDDFIEFVPDADQESQIEE